MKRRWKISVVVCMAVAAGVGACASFSAPSPVNGLEDVPTISLRASDDPQLVERGAYVVHAVAHCSACHGEVAHVSKGQLGPRDDLSGGKEFKAGPFGTFRAANISSDVETGIGAMSDAELGRAIRHGVDRRGRYAAFMALSTGPMADEDLVAVISYLRSLPPKKNAVADDEWGLVARFVVGDPRARVEAAPPYVPPGEPSVARGRYLAEGPGFCYGCHTQTDPMKGFVEVKPRFSGGAAEPDPTDPGFEIAAPNLTPHDKPGWMTSWTEDAFVHRFRLGRVYRGSKMPWENFAQMSDADLRSIFRYLQTLPPVDHAVGPSRRPKG